MGLTDDLDAIAPTANSGKRPLYQRLREALNDEERAAFDAALDDPDRVSAPKLAQVLRENGHPVAASSIRAWRRGESR